MSRRPVVLLLLLLTAGVFSARFRSLSSGEGINRGWDPVHFEMENGRGEASRWNTLRALRVLDWYSKAL